MSTPALSQLSDEQLGVYREMLSKRQAESQIPPNPSNNIPAAKPPTPAGLRPNAPLPSVPTMGGEAARNLPSSVANYTTGGFGMGPDTMQPTSRVGQQDTPGASFGNLARHIGNAASDTASDIVHTFQHPAESFAREPIATANTLGAPAQLTKPAMALHDAIPSAERAGQGFERVMKVAGDQPVDLTKASIPVTRALELSSHGAGSPPAVISKMAERIPQHNPLPMNFREARDFSSNAGRLSGQELQNMNPQMKAQVNQLAKALADANMETAEKAGVGPEFKAAMKEYRQAMKLNDFKENATKYAKKIAGAVILGSAGYEAAKHLIP